MNTPWVVAALLLGLPWAAGAFELRLAKRDCAFVVGQSHAAPDWFMTSGRAAVTIAANRFKAELYLDEPDGGLSHTLSGRLQPVRERAGNRIGNATATMVTLGTDSGNAAMHGKYVFTRWKHGDDQVTNLSITLQDGGGFSAITCYFRRAQ